MSGHCPVCGIEFTETRSAVPTPVAGYYEALCTPCSIWARHEFARLLGIDGVLSQHGFDPSKGLPS